MVMMTATQSPVPKRTPLTMFFVWLDIRPVVSRVRLIFAIMPREGSTLACMDEITPTTTISQLDGFAGNTPVMMPFLNRMNFFFQECSPDRQICLRASWLRRRSMPSGVTVNWKATAW